MLQNNLIAYQVQDTFKMDLPPNSVDLVISSPPLDILAERPVALFEWLDRCVSDDGVLLLDTLGQYNKYTIGMWEGERKTSWHFQWGMAFHNFYQTGDTQSVCAYAKNRGTMQRPDSIPIRPPAERNMRHRCEYDAVYVEFLIGQYSNQGETVLDPFCGTGTVPCTAYQLGRNGIGIDRRCPFTNTL